METMSVREFAEAVGICYDKALSVCHSAKAPKGFWCGNQYRVLVSGVGEWVEMACEEGLRL